jgi:trimethylamine--corrinoid protein Co-methyltransferase
MIHDMGYMESGLTGSLELVVIEDEIVSLIRAGSTGLDFNEENLALDLVHEHALSADFMGTEHTLRHCREGWQPRLIDRQSFKQWKDEGGTSMRDRARVVIDEILAGEPRLALPPEIAQKITAIADQAVVEQSG